MSLKTRFCNGSESLASIAEFRQNEMKRDNAKIAYKLPIYLRYSLASVVCATK